MPYNESVYQTPWIRIEDNGSAKVYIENNGIRYLVFDSSRSGTSLEEITAFAVKEEKNKTKNNPPVWDSDIESFIVNGSLNIDLNDHFSDKDNDTLTYSFDEIGDLSISIVDSILTINNENNIVGEEKLSVYADDSEKSKKKKIVLVLLNTTVVEEEVNETINITLPLNETINQTETINETEPIENVSIINMSETNVSEHIQNLTVLNKSITISLEYKDTLNYDEDNDGVETSTGVVDLTVEDTQFNWNVDVSEMQNISDGAQKSSIFDEENLCARWNIYSEDDEESTTVCYGSEQCCNFIDLTSSRANWNEAYYSNYGKDSATTNNLISSQVIYVDYNLSLEDPYSDIVYSEWSNLSASFVSEAETFENICVETCLLANFNKSSYKLIFEINNTVLYLDSIKYSVIEAANTAPVLVKNISNITINKNSDYTIDLGEYFGDDDALFYGYYETDNITIQINNTIATITPDENFTGTRYMFFSANDSELSVVSNVFKINITIAGIARLPSSKKFVIKDSSGDAVASIDSKGDLYLRGTSNENQINLTPTPNSFIIQNRYADNIAYINSTGHLFLKGNLNKKAAMQATGSNLEIRNSSDELVAFFDNQGNLGLRGESVENYANP